jgi:two-component system response regulator HydG
MKSVFDTIERVGSNDRSTVLILGESGTGKEVAASRIHFASGRANQPFVAINCTTFTPQLLASELFGHERGAFTGATSQKKGLFEIASEGTLFLDEIGDMPVEQQAQLLRVLEEKTIRRVGGTKDIRVNTRVLAATNRDLREAIEAATFREDLFYRLNIVEIKLPPLRHRIEDIQLIAESYVNFFNREFGRRITGFTVDAMLLMETYHWPGNIRQLRNVVERAFILVTEDGTHIGVQHLPPEISANSATPVRHAVQTETLSSFKEAKLNCVERFEKEYVDRVLQQFHGNVTRAATHAGMDRSNFLRILRKYAIQAESYR